LHRRLHTAETGPRCEGKGRHVSPLTCCRLLQSEHTFPLYDTCLLALLLPPERASPCSLTSRVRYVLVRSIRYAAITRNDRRFFSSSNAGAMLSRLGGIISARVSSDEDVLRMRVTTETTGRLPITFICLFPSGDRYSNVECNPSIYRYADDLHSRRLLCRENADIPSILIGF